MKFICFVNRKKIYEQVGEKYFYKLEKIFQDFKMYQLTINCSLKQTKKRLSKRKIFQDGI